MTRMDAQEWMQQLDTSASCHASTLAHAIRCGMVSNKLHAARRQERSTDLSVSWILSGSGQLSVEDKTHALHAGCVVLRRPGEECSLALDAHVVHRRCYLHMDHALYPMLCMLLPELPTLPPVRVQPFDESLFARFRALFEAVGASDEQSPLPFLPELRAVLCGLLGLRDGTADERILKAATLLTSLSPTTPLPEIAKRCDIPYGQFRKRFTQVYGAAPGQWRIGQRVQRAQQALACGETIQKVAEQLEYADVYTFTHQFRDVTGLTPKAYQLHHID